MNVTAALGPVQGPLLAAIAGTGDKGATARDLAGLIGRPRYVVDQALRGLDVKGCVCKAAWVPRAGKASAIWVATTTGRAALAAAGEVAG